MENNSNADELLKIVKRDEQKSREGNLKIFFGMSAGVGKTYAMLTESHQKIKDGKKLIIGTVDTHGRVETQNLVAGLPILPKKEINYRNTIFYEMDLDAILKAEPEIVVVDELAHTNIPGSRHPKRWQDVIEILGHGIDVYTTLNVQHIESLKNDIEQITGIVIRETVPDSIIDRANHIEVIDLPPEDLLKRLKEGKIYLNDKAEQAMKNFFQEEKLMALREFALRITADKVDLDLKEMRATSNPKGAVWRTQETLLVAVGDGIYSEKLIRLAKQQAVRLDCPWVALYVDTGETKSEKSRRIITFNLNLARELGAEVVSTADTDLVLGIERTCLQKQVTQIIIGRPRKLWWRDIFYGGSFIDRLNRSENNMAILIVRQDYPLPNFLLNLGHLLHWRKNHFVIVTAILVLVTSINYLLHYHFKILPYRSIGLIFLMVVSLVGILMPIIPTLVASILATIVWNVFFIPPLYNFSTQRDDITLCFTFFFISLINGALNTALKKREKLIRTKEERTQALYQIIHYITSTPNREDCINHITEHLAKLLGGICGVSIKNEQGTLEHFKKGSDWPFNRTKEWAAALWAFDHETTAGLGTDTLPYAEAIYIPLKGKESIVGVLAFRPDKTKNKLSIDEEELLLTVCSQIALYLEATSSNRA